MSPGTGNANSVQGKKIIVCVTGGIAAYKVIEVVRALTQMGADVRVVMTHSAQRFVGAQTFASLSGNKVLTEVFDESPDAPHVELARGADLALVAPATANSIAKLALGVADDLVGATLLMTRCPLLVAPAMHTEMWEHPATQEHVATLQARGAKIVGPASGPLMSGDEGAGRLVEPQDLVDAILASIAQSEDLEGKSLVVTAGGTQEPIDAVRFIGNRSSGLMGIAIAEAARTRGAKVTLVAGPSVVANRPAGVDIIDVHTAEEMREAVLQHAPSADVIVKAAAVADFRPDHSTAVKLKKAEGPPAVALIPTPDILAELGADHSLRKSDGILVGFAAETEADPERLSRLALAKKESKGADVIVANDVGSPDSGFGARTNRAVIAGPDGVTDVGLVTKQALAEALVDKVSELLKRRRLG
jgi:phosphopantothenoylcysteine decarboxylase / phosphopantothenate---cysteine ligase